MSKHCGLSALLIFFSFFGYAQTGVPSSQDSSDENFFAQFNCSVRTSNSVWLEWKTSSPAEGDYFIVERSPNGIQYETISALKIADTTSGFAVMDSAPLSGSFFYRIKWVGKTGKTLYSQKRSVSVSPEVDFKFYPNPTDKLLIIRTAHSIDVQILDASGIARLTKQVDAGLQIINVSSLEKGTYVLKVADKEGNKVVSEQLLKN